MSYNYGGHRFPAGYDYQAALSNDDGHQGDDTAPDNSEASPHGATQEINPYSFPLADPTIWSAGPSQLAPAADDAGQSVSYGGQFNGAVREAALDPYNQGQWHSGPVEAYRTAFTAGCDDTQYLNPGVWHQSHGALTRSHTAYASHASSYNDRRHDQDPDAFFSPGHAVPVHGADTGISPHFLTGSEQAAIDSMSWEDIRRERLTEINQGKSNAREIIDIEGTISRERPHVESWARKRRDECQSEPTSVELERFAHFVSFPDGW